LLLDGKVQPDTSTKRWVGILWLVLLPVGFFAATIVAHIVAARLHLSVLAAASAGQLGIFLVAIIFALADGGGFRSLGLLGSWQATDAAVIPGIIFIHFVGSMIVSAILQATGQVDPSKMEVMKVFGEFGKLTFPQFAGTAGLLALQAGIGEELLFRGYLITRLERVGLGAWPCILLSGLIFGLIHVPSGYGFLPSLSKGIFFGIPTGIYFWYRRNLGPTMVAHALMDFVGFLALYAMLKLTGGIVPGL
jgi:membrane protease YdiL (CAAX protease family)